MRALRMSSGVIVWALHFTVIYGFTALACARGFAAAAPWAVGLATLVGGLIAVLLILKYFRREEFTAWMTAAIAGFALLAILWEGIPALLVPACA